MLQSANTMLVLYPPPESFIGKEFDGYRIDSVLGTGGMGIVFRATQLELERQVALKVINPTLAKDESFIQRFKVEAHALAKIHHPNIVVIYNFRPFDHGFYIAMEYVSGNTLTELIRSKGRVSWQESLLLARQILSALQSTHKAGIIHRDIKPSNILINDNNFVKVTDFGLAKVKSAPGSQEDSTVSLDAAGTLCYMPPEQVRGLQKVDHRGDIYSVGLTLYAALAGRLPFDRGGTVYEIQKSIAEKTFTPVKKYAPEMPRELSRVIMKAIEKEPHRRFQAADKMLHALEAINPTQLSPQKTYSFSPAPITPTTSATSPSQSRPLILPVILTFLIGLVIISFTPLSVANLFSTSGASRSQTLAEQIQQQTLTTHEDSVHEENIKHKVADQGKNTLGTDNTDPLPSSSKMNASTPKTPDKQLQTEKNSRDARAKVIPPAYANTINTGSIRIRTSPSHSEVFLNGVLVGNTPLLLDQIPSGSFDMEIRKENYEPQVFTGTVSPLEITFIDRKMAPIQGFLHLDISPPSDVYLNDKKVSIGPTAIFEREVLATTHEIAITHPTYGEWTRSITILPGDTTQHTFDFSKKIKVSVTAFDDTDTGVHAEIIVDNKPTGKYTPAQLSLVPGKHVISVQLDGYALTNRTGIQNYDASSSAPIRFILKKND